MRRARIPLILVIALSMQSGRLQAADAESERLLRTVQQMYSENQKAITSVEYTYEFTMGEMRREARYERDGEKFFTRFRGKLQGETIRGESLSDLGRDSRPRPWEAIRVEE